MDRSFTLIEPMHGAAACLYSYESKFKWSHSLTPCHDSIILCCITVHYRSLTETSKWRLCSPADCDCSPAAPFAHQHAAIILSSALPSFESVFRSFILGISQGSAPLGWTLPHNKLTHVWSGSTRPKHIAKLEYIAILGAKQLDSRRRIASKFGVENLTICQQHRRPAPWPLPPKARISSPDLPPQRQRSIIAPPSRIVAADPPRCACRLPH